MRVVSYNIRNVRALDRSSWWFRRRRAVADVIRRLDGDLVGVQEAYPSQVRWLAREVFGEAYGCSGVGRNRDGGGEGVQIFHRRAELTPVERTTRWFGEHPDEPGSKMPGAPFPRIATIVDLMTPAGRPFRAVNLHLDSDDVERRTASLEQLAGWLDPAATATIVFGDFNGPLSEPGFDALTAAGLRSALAVDAGPTSNGFGRNPDQQQQIDHVFVSGDIEVSAAWIDTGAGHASDHFPVVVDVRL